MVKHETNNDNEFIKQLEDLIEKVKAGEVEDCSIKVLLAKDAEKKKKHDVEDLSEEDCKKLLHAIFDENDEDEEEPVCNGDCESCENYVEEEEDDPEDILEDLGNVIGCMTYYRLPISSHLLFKYNDAALEKIRNADD